MANGRLKRESNPIPGEIPGFLPQHESSVSGEFVVTGENNPYPTKVKNIHEITQRLDSLEEKIDKILDGTQPANVQLTGSNATLDVNVINNWKLQEQLTQADAVNGTLTFSDVVKAVDIFNQDATNSGVFTINGLSITVPANTFFSAEIGGTPSNTVTVSGSTSYIIGRYA